MRYQDASCIHRSTKNPILSPGDIPYGCDKVYNPAACKMRDDYHLILRTDRSEDPRQCLGLAKSADGISFDVEPEPILTPALDEFGHLNDPRVTHIDGYYYLAYCSDPGGDGLREEGIYLCIARSRDLRSWERIYRSEPDNRNAVIFPEHINGLYARLDRPFRRGYRTEYGYDIWVSYSPDMVFWGKHQLVLSHLDVEWGHHKIGPAAPPIRTDEGWLVFFHGAEIDPGNEDWLPWVRDGKPYRGKVYRTGLMLLDFDDPSRIIARCVNPVLTPRESYEMDPYYRPNVVFPCGIIPEVDGSIKIYYGASDRHVALATARTEDLLELVRGG